jgi:hypothetical protein
VHENKEHKERGREETRHSKNKMNKKKNNNDVEFEKIV